MASPGAQPWTLSLSYTGLIWTQTVNSLFPQAHSVALPPVLPPALLAPAPGWTPCVVSGPGSSLAMYRVKGPAISPPSYMLCWAGAIPQGLNKGFAHAEVTLGSQFSFPYTRVTNIVCVCERKYHIGKYSSSAEKLLKNLCLKLCNRSKYWRRQ